MREWLVVLVLVAAATPVAAQPPPAPQPPRARTVAAMTLTTTAWSDGGEIPIRHSQAGRDVSPPIAWSGVPDDVVSFVLLVRDVDAAGPPSADDTLHWLVWNIPGTATGLGEGMPAGNAPPVPASFGAPARPPTDGPRQISATGPNYRGPAAPSSGPAHHYLFELYALDTWIDVPAVGQSPAATRSAVVAAMAGRVRGKGVLAGRFRRPAP